MNRFLDGGGLAYLWDRIKAALTDKVDKVEGKVLSSNDYTDEEKSKLGSLENYTLPVAGAETLGGIMVGERLAINGGVLSVLDGGKADEVEWDGVLNRPELALKSDLAGKQDRLSGTTGQLVGFDAQGRAAAMTSEYVTEREMNAAIAGAVTGAMEAVY